MIVITIIIIAWFCVVVSICIVSLHCVSKTSPFLFLWYICQISSDSANFGQKHARRKFKTNTCTRSIHVASCMLVMYLAKLATHQKAHCDVGRFPFVLSLHWNLTSYLKAYLNLWHYNLCPKIQELNFYLQKLQIYINFLLKYELQRRLAAWSGLVCTGVSSARQSTI